MKRVTTIGNLVTNVDHVSSSDSSGFQVADSVRVAPGYTWNGSTSSPVFTAGAPLPPPPIIATMADVDAVSAAIPVPGTTAPPAVADNSAEGAVSLRYAREDHTHASKARKQIKTQGSAAATYTWVYPVPFASGVIPVVSAIVQVAAGTTDLFNVQVMGAPTNTQCTFQINRVSAGLLALLLGALSLNSTPVINTLHMTALEP